MIAIHIYDGSGICPNCKKKLTAKDRAVGPVTFEKSTDRELSQYYHQEIEKCGEGKE